MKNFIIVVALIILLGVLAFWGTQEREISFQYWGNISNSGVDTNVQLGKDRVRGFLFTPPEDILLSEIKLPLARIGSQTTNMFYLRIYEDIGEIGGGSLLATLTKPYIDIPFADYDERDAFFDLTENWTTFSLEVPLHLMKETQYLFAVETNSSNINNVQIGYNPTDQVGNGLRWYNCEAVDDCAWAYSGSMPYPIFELSGTN